MQDADALLSPLGGSPSLTAGAPARLRDFQVLQEIGRALEATRQFQAVRYTLPEADAVESGVVRLACLRLAGGVKKPTWDEGNPAGLQILERESAFNLTIIYRDPNPQLFQAELDRLFEVASNAIDGESFGATTVDGAATEGSTVPSKTYLVNWNYEEPSNVEQRLRIVGKFARLVTGWKGNNTLAG